MIYIHAVHSRNEGLVVWLSGQALGPEFKPQHWGGGGRRRFQNSLSYWGVQGNLAQENAINTNPESYKYNN